MLLFLPLGYRTVGFQFLRLLQHITFNIVSMRYYISTLVKRMQPQQGWNA
jgi:hypothetical protein